MTDAILQVVFITVPILGSFWAAWRTNTKKLAEIHVLVNWRLSEALARIEELEKQLIEFSRIFEKRYSSCPIS
jgi:hypothetical protein